MNNLKAKSGCPAGVSVRTQLRAKSKMPGAEAAAFGQNVSDKRATVKMQQNELARRIGVSKQTMANIENGHYWPSLLLYRRICVALKLGELPLFEE